MQHHGAARSTERSSISAGRESHLNRYALSGFARAAPAAGLLIAGLSCAPADEAVEETLAITDVGDSIDSRIRPEEDSREQAGAELLVGILPSDFPADVWVYRPSTVSNFGAADSEERFVELRVREEMASVAEQLDLRLAGDGWRGESLSTGRSTFSKGPRQLQVTLQDQNGETLIRIEY